jgi:hypothetical protein
MTGFTTQHTPVIAPIDRGIGVSQRIADHFLLEQPTNHLLLKDTSSQSARG